MRFFIIIIIFFIGSNCSAQTLRDSLYGGKLKIDSAILKKANVAVVQKNEKDSLKKTESGSISKLPGDSAIKQGDLAKPALEFKDNPKTWKKFIDQFTATINTEVLSAKKVKKGYYTVMIDYEIGTDGVVSTKTITSSPSNDYLVDQINERFASSAPLMAPLIRDGVPRKSAKRQIIVFTKEKN